MLTAKKQGWVGKCQVCWGKIETGSMVHARPTSRHTIAMRCLSCGDFPPPPEPLDPSWFDKERLPSGSYRMRSPWIRSVSNCVSCRERIHVSDWMYWNPKKGPRCAACGDHPPNPDRQTDPWHITYREIDWLRSLVKVTFADVN